MASMFLSSEERVGPRRVAGLAWQEGTVFALYCCIQAWMCCVHEAWGDEAQAWLLARDSSLWDLFYRHLHYEGTPGLWHLLLWLEARAGVSYLGMHWISSGLGALGVYLLLRYAPFPRPIRLLFPLTFALLYQGTIVARSYGLILPLIAGLSALRTSPRRRPVLYAMLLGLLANTSALGALLALGLVVERFVSAWREPSRVPRPMFLPAAGVSVLLWGLALYSVLPAPDAHFAFLSALNPRPRARVVLASLTGTSLPSADPNAVAQATAEAVPVASPLASPMQRNRLQQALYESEHPPQVTFATHLLRNGLLILGFNLFVVSPSNLLALAFYAALILWLVKNRTLRFAVPLLFLAVVGPKLYISPHHAMVWWFALVGLLWTAWPTIETTPYQSRSHRAFCAVLILVLVEQAAFAAHALYFDSRYAFDGGQAAERFIEQSASAQPVAAYTFFPVSLQPYARSNLFVNRATSYERWKLQDRTDLAVSTVETYHPRMVVVGESYSGTRNVDNQIVPVTLPGTLLEDGSERLYLTTHNFRETHRFCGDQPINFGVYERVCQVIFEPITPK